MKRFIGATVLLTLLTIVFWQGCTRLPTQTAGGSGSETVIGKALMPGGAPAAKAAIRLRSAGYLAPLNGAATNTGPRALTLPPTIPGVFRSRRPKRVRIVWK